MAPRSPAMWRVDALLLNPSASGRGRASRSLVSVEAGRVHDVVGDVQASSHAAAQSRRVGSLPIGRLALPPGAVVVPGLRDPHLHLRAMAAARLSVDCRAAHSLVDILESLRAACLVSGTSSWLRGWGYDEADLAERRGPTADELDAACNGRPVVLHHRTGHAAVLSRAALRAIRIPETGEPGVGDDGVERDANGTATGLLVNSHALLRRVPHLGTGDLDAAVAAVGRQLAATGVTAMTDATATNQLEDLTMLESWRARGALPQRVTALLSPAAVADAVTSGVTTLAHRQADRQAQCVVVGAKISAPPDEIPDQIATAREYGWPVAVHATDVEELNVALSALERSKPPSWGRDRIEHVGLALPEQRDRLAATGVAVVSNPGFLRERGNKYFDQLSAVERLWLYPVKSLIEAGVTVAAASDGPVSDAGPLETARAAVERSVGRGANAGKVLGPGERVSPLQAFAMITSAAAALIGESGAIRTGSDADFAVLDRDPSEGLEQVCVLVTVIGGTIISTAPGLDSSLAGGQPKM